MTEERKERKERKGGMNIDLSFGGLFKGIENLVNMASKLKDAGEGEGMQKEGEIDLSHLKEGMKGVFGFSFKTAAGGKPDEEITLIDSGVKTSIDNIFSYISQNQRDPSEISTLILSHSHPDHIGSAMKIKKMTVIKKHKNQFQKNITQTPNFMI